MNNYVIRNWKVKREAVKFNFQRKTGIWLYSDIVNNESVRGDSRTFDCGSIFTGCGSVNLKDMI